jgi:hypothetical protein
MKSISQILKPLFTPKLKERQMTIATATPPAQVSTAIRENLITEAQEESAPLARSTKAAQDFFKNREYVDQIAVIQQIGKTEAEVSIFDRALGRRITVNVPLTDRMEADALELASRFSNARTETVHC